MIETGQIRQELVQDVGGLLIGKLTAALHLKCRSTGIERCGKRAAAGDEAVE
jgi:hypothetical protein